MEILQRVEERWKQRVAPIIRLWLHLFVYSIKAYTLSIQNMIYHRNLNKVLII